MSLAILCTLYVNAGDESTLPIIDLALHIMRVWGKRENEVCVNYADSDYIGYGYGYG